jgi:Rrf2 family protein
MMISRTADHALRAVAFLAGNFGMPSVRDQIAASTQIPTEYLAKVMCLLAKAKLVQSRRGLHGGFVLARPPEEISLLEVINAVDPLERIEQCPLRIAGHERLCPLHHRLDALVEIVETVLRDTSIADLLERPPETLLQSLPHCKAGTN